MYIIALHMCLKNGHIFIKMENDMKEKDSVTDALIHSRKSQYILSQIAKQAYDSGGLLYDDG
jgi:hypothetical protein